jgi:hypothetical protein
MGFVFFKLMDVKVHLIWTSFAILPVVVGTFIFFIGNFISNDYFFYDPKFVVPDASKVGDASQKAEKEESRLAQIAKEGFCSEFGKFLCFGYIPKNRSTKDKMNFGKNSMTLKSL